MISLIDKIKLFLDNFTTNFWIFKYSPNSKTFESIVEPYYTGNRIKCEDYLYIIARTWMTQKMFFQLLTNSCSVMAASDSWNIVFYCGCIFTQSLSKFEIDRNCVLILFLCNHEEWDFLDWHFSNYRPNLVQRYSPSKTSPLLVKYCTIWLCFKIGPISSNSRLIFIHKELRLLFNKFRE